MKGMIRLALTLASVGALVGCGMETLDPPAPAPDPSGSSSGETGLALTVDLSDVESVAGVRFIVETCEGEEVIVDERSLEELDFPDDDAFEDLGVNGREGVIFADYFVVLEAGCYDVEIVPIDEDGGEVELCEPALASGVDVRPGETTEIAMVSQCGGDNFGAMDVLGVLNFSPTLTKLDFDPSKLVACEEVTICATAVDSDADDIEFEWEQLAGPTPREGIEVSSTSDPNADGEVVECVTLTPGNTGAYAFEVRAYDVMVDGDGERVRVEDLLGEVGEDDDARSHARLSFPIYSTCDEPDDEGVLGEVENDPQEERKDKEHRDDDAEEGVLGEVEDEPDDERKDKEHRDDDVDEDVLGEVEDDEEEEEHKKKGQRDDDVEEDVLGEVEDDEEEEEEHKKKGHRDDEVEEDVLGEVEDDEEEEHKKKGHRDDDVEEDVLGEVEDDEEEEEHK